VAKVGLREVGGCPEFRVARPQKQNRDRMRWIESNPGIRAKS